MTNQEKIDKAITDAFSSCYNIKDINILKTLCCIDDIIAVLYCVQYTGHNDSWYKKIMFIDLNYDYSKESEKYENWMYLAHINYYITNHNSPVPIRNRKAFYKICKEISDSGILNLI